MQLSPHFTLREFTKSQMAERLGIDNYPSPLHITNLTHLATNLLEPLRTLVQKTIVITSGYRCHTLSEAIGSSSKSQHCVGNAVDIEVFGVSTYDLADLIVTSLDFDQCILECYTGETNSGWVHVSLVQENNRQEVLTYDKVNGYRKGLIK